jgi:hypothetical protein
MGQNGKCRLCAQESNLRISHAVPKFVFDHVKTTGFGLRNIVQPNLAVQDGFKKPMLCEGCEQRLGRWERQVSLRLFAPLHDHGITQHRYGPWLLPFAVSVSFRVLADFRDGGLLGIDSERRQFPRNCERDADDALGSWRRFLMGESASVGRFEQHAFPLSDPPAPTALERAVRAYVRTGIDMVAPLSPDDGGLYVVVKMCRLMCIGVIRKGTGTSRWRYTKIHRRGGALGGMFRAPEWIPNYLLEMAYLRRDAWRETSDRQRVVIRNRVLGSNDPVQ